MWSRPRRLTRSSSLVQILHGYRHGPTDHPVSSDPPIPILTLPTAVPHCLAGLTALELLFHIPTDTTSIRIHRGCRCPPQILFRFSPTQFGLGRGCIRTKLGMQSHDRITILLTSRRTIVKIPTLATAKLVWKLFGFDITAGRCRTFGKVAPALRGLIFRVAHKTDGKEFALHAVAGVAEDRGGFVESGVGGESGDTRTAFCFESFENVLPAAEHVPVLVENIEHGAPAEDGYEFLGVNGNGKVVECVPRFTGDGSEEFFAFKVNDTTANV